MRESSSFSSKELLQPRKLCALTHDSLDTEPSRTTSPGSMHSGLCKKTTSVDPWASAASSFHRRTGAWLPKMSLPQGTPLREIGFPADLNRSGLESCIF